MNHTAVAGNLSAFKSDMDVIRRQDPKITFLLGETNSDYINLNMTHIEGVFGSALWLIDYLLYGMTMVSRFRLSLYPNPKHGFSAPLQSWFRQLTAS
jgi:hypothetical protein